MQISYNSRVPRDFNPVCIGLAVENKPDTCRVAASSMTSDDSIVIMNCKYNNDALPCRALCWKELVFKWSVSTVPIEFWHWFELFAMPTVPWLFGRCLRVHLFCFLAFRILKISSQCTEKNKYYRKQSAKSTAMYRCPNFVFRTASSPVQPSRTQVLHKGKSPLWSWRMPFFDGRYAKILQMTDGGRSRLSAARCRKNSQM